MAETNDPGNGPRPDSVRDLWMRPLLRESGRALKLRDSALVVWLPVWLPLAAISMVAFKTKREIETRYSEFEMVRATQVQRGERIATVENRVDRLEHVQRTKVSLDWPSGQVHAALSSERAVDQEPKAFVDAVASEFTLMADKFPPKDR